MGVCVKFQEHCQFDKSFNVTFVALIPTSGVDDLKDFRPIIWVGSMYKIITKVLANRLKSVLGKIISPSKCDFMPSQ